MPARNENLHGSAPDKSPVALLVIDMINDLEFDGGEKLLPQAVRAARQIAALKRRARAARIPVIYANDNFGRWRSDFREAVRHCLEDDVLGQPLAELLHPEPEDYFVLKPKHSAFYATTLATLLQYLGARRLILTGINGDNCVLMTAIDAYVRDFELHVPADCTASIVRRHNTDGLAYMKRMLHAATGAAEKLDLRKLRRGVRRSRS